MHNCCPTYISNDSITISVSEMSLQHMRHSSLAHVQLNWARCILCLLLCRAWQKNYKWLGGGGGVMFMHCLLNKTAVIDVLFLQILLTSSETRKVFFFFLAHHFFSICCLVLVGKHVLHTGILSDANRNGILVRLVAWFLPLCTTSARESERCCEFSKLQDGCTKIIKSQMLATGSIF